MSDNELDRAFSAASASRPSFTERVGRPDALSAPANENSQEPSVYKAYGFLPSSTVGETCDVQRWVDGTEIAEGIEFQYRFLLQIAYVGESELRLYLPDSIVLIEGANLRDLRKKLARRQVTFIQQYSSRVWPVKPVGGDPFIASIEVIRGEPIARKVL